MKNNNILFVAGFGQFRRQKSEPDALPKTYSASRSKPRSAAIFPNEGLSEVNAFALWSSFVSLRLRH